MPDIGGDGRSVGLGRKFNREKALITQRQHPLDDVMHVGCAFAKAHKVDFPDAGVLLEMDMVDAQLEAVDQGIHVYC